MMNKSSEKHMYRRDFIILKKDKRNDLRPRIPSCFLINSFFDYDVYSHNILDVNKFLISRKNTGVCLIGYALNPFTGANDNSRIAQHLAKLLSEDESNFFDYLDQLSGRFLLLCKKEDREFLLQDAMGYRCALYSTDPTRFMIASHTSLFQSVFDFRLNEEAFHISTQENYSMGGNYLPGLMTAISQVRPLLPNTFIDLRTISIHRFFPREELERNELTDEFVEKISKVLCRQNEMLTKRFKVVLSLTGGLDSRISLATLKNHTERLDKVFTYIINGNQSHKKDISIAPKIAEQAHLTSFSTINVKKSDLLLGDFLDKSQKIVNCNIKKSSSDMIALYLVGVEDPSTVHYMSYGPEVFNCYFTKNPINRDGVLSLDKLCRLYKRSLVHLTKDAWQEFIDIHNPQMKEVYGYCPYDLLYWEHRNGAWLGARMSDTDMVADTFVPFNNRKILKEFLSIRQDLRRTKEIHKKLIQFNWPELLEIDFT
ncbi:hypothetical protein [Oceanimonas baumannii]|uniref:asparagine synthase (glutamine-hydrolyzing) n=1 Tax=Oceanimonas baumannii TaxID=129578 RepID=A0A235C922_9GAMM|nr:hypothetical protein [Oceanimonas baumannii]OYD21128.1 hypothetical protein B6S09_17435 [Oceanimonas baumannii]TDW56959.1 NAD synthase [Oceanimonas baumannii]